MSKKMWSRIFKTKSTNKTPGISKKSSLATPPTVTSSAAENRLSYYEEFHNCCQQQPPAKAKASRKQAAPPDGAVKTPSKFSKVVNTFTLKRSSKENQSNQLNTTTPNQLEGNSPTSGDKHSERKYAENDENVGGPNMDKTETPTAALKSAQADNTIEATEESVSLELIPCPTCSRTFVPKTLEKHMRICEKMTVKKRKIFDSSRQRREGTELAAYPLPKNYGLPPAKTEKSLSPKPHQAPPPVLSPRRPSEEVAKPPVLAKAATPAAARKMISPMPTSTNLMTSSTGHSSSAPKERTRAAVVPKRIQPPPAEPCPYCERCFGMKAYDRHVEWCKEKALIASIKQNSTNSQVAAKERLEARIKYRAPCLKTKRSVNRDKYSGLNDENGDPMHGSAEDAHPKMSAMTSSMSSSFMSDGSKPSNRLNPLKKAPTPPSVASRLQPSSTPSLSESTGKRRNVCPPPRTATKPASVPKLDFIKSLSTNTLGSEDAAAPMSDGDLEMLFQREFKGGPTRPLPVAKLNAVMQAPKSDPKIMSKRKKVEAPRAQPETLPKLEASGCGNARRMVKERIEFFDSSSSSSSASCRAETVVSSQQVPTCLPNHKSFILSGLSDKYDPFLSAKRQLEELCSPSSPTDSIFSQPSLTPVSKAAFKPATTATPITPNTMTTSLTSTSSLTNPRRALTTVKSNFRRTSSLRAPRRSPLPIPTRSIFFPTTQKQRPTIQRGLSDEGPISSNFLKPEEYDEMPVRSVCVNDFAITNTPRVIRRDSNSAANRRNLRLQLPTPGQSSKENTPTPPVGTGNNSLLKTDSLAVFLKYENEAKAVENPVINTKELKDKSNTLSKQNSAKSVAACDDQLRPTEITPSRNDNSNGGPGNLNTIKLEPISKPASAKQTASPQPTKRPTPPTVVSPLAVKPVNLNLIFDTRDRLPEVDRDYIDPKLINVCDNLPMELGSDLPLSSNSSSSTSSSGDGERADAETEKIDHAEHSPHPTSSTTNSSPSPQTFKRAPSPAPQLKATPATNSCTNSNRNSSGDSRNLKRKMRPGRNQFLYDASPESEARENDADDERNNRSSCEPDIHQLHHRSLFSTAATISTTSTPHIPPFSPSTFDEFDFEEFLSSFDNDDEQFPSLFKDCREFLLNRTTLTNRSNTQTDNISSYRSGTGGNNSIRKYEQEVEQNLNCVENKKRGEIFISIETDQNENDPHPKNDPLVAANPTAQIEEVDANDNKFRKIEDTDIDVDGDNEDDDGRQGGHDQRRGNCDGSDDHLRRRRINLLNDFPNVRLNNAKNLVQQMHEDFRELYTNSAADAEDQLNGNSVIQVTGSSLYPVDSDEISSIECYPVRRGGSGSGSVSGRGSSSCAVVQPKHSADSAYGSLSRQSPTADITPRYHSSLSNRTRTPATPHDQTQQYQFQYPTSSPTQYKYSNLNKSETQKYRSRDFSIGSSSSGSDNSLPPIKANKNLPTLQDHQARTTFHRNHSTLSAAGLENKIGHSAQMSGVGSTNSSTNNLDPSSTCASPTAAARPSKFCHECGTRFLLEQAKFCMDCGVRRIILK